MKFLYILLLLPFLGFSQPDFQRVYQVGIGSSHFLAIEEHEGDLFVVGAGYNVDSLFGMYVYKIDTFGNVLDYIMAVDSPTILTTYNLYSDVVIDSNEIYVCGGRYGTQKTNYHLVTNTALDSVTIYDYTTPEDSVIFEGFTKMLVTESAIYTIGVEQIEDLTTNGLLLKTDKSGNVIWRKTYGVQGMDERFVFIKQLSENKILLSGALTNDYDIFANPAPLVKIYGIMYVVDTLGNVLWEWQHPGGVSQYTGMVINPVIKNDTMYFVCAYFYQDFSQPNTLNFDYEPFVVAMTMDGDFVWETKLPFTSGWLANSSFNKDSSAIVASGFQFKTRNEYIHFEVGLDGRMHYARKDSFCTDSLYSSFYIGTIIGQVILRSGSTISCGYVNAYEENTGWLDRSFLIKTNPSGLPDSSYCGWQETIFLPPTSAAEVVDFRPQLLLYPNPTSDIVFIEMPDGNTLGIDEVRVYSADGRLVLVKNVNKQSQISVSLAGEAQGVFLFQFLVGGEIVTTQQVIKTNKQH